MEVLKWRKAQRKKLVSFGMCLAVSAALLSTSAIAAYQDNDIDYSFRIQGSVDNAQEKTGRFRDTRENTNSWKVQLVKSGEGKGSFTNFWIENKNGSSASEEYSIKQGDKPRYKPANDKGDHITVYLTAENNNWFSTEQYNVSGIWDEETGRYL